MPDPALRSAPTSGEEWVLLDRSVVCVDELQEVIRETGGVPLDRSIAAVLEALPPCSSRARKEYQEQSAIEKEMTRYREKVEEPAFAILRERKACRRGTGAARKEPVTFKCDDADYYREVLDGIDARLPLLAGAPAVNSLTLSISWPPEHHLRNYPWTAYIASCHANLLAIYFGTHRTECYLVFNSWDDTLAVIPPLPTGCVTTTSHCGIGAAGVAVLSQDMTEKAYLLAELFLHKDARTHLGSNKATLFVWCSPDSGPLTNRWIHKEVVLPLPSDRQGTCCFRANMVLQVSSTSLCWVDLQTGILLCRHISSTSLAAGDDLEFEFIPLPLECAMEPDPLTWRQAEDYRSMCRVEHDTIIFACIDDFSQAQSMSSSVLRTWILRLNTFRNAWMWMDYSRAFPLEDFNASALIKDGGKLQRLVPSCPIISCRKPFDIYLSVADLRYDLKHDQWKVAHLYEVCINRLKGDHRSSVFEFSSGFPHSQVFGYEVRNYLDKGELQRCQFKIWKELPHEEEPKSSAPWRVRDTAGLRGEEVSDEDESHRASLIVCRDVLGVHCVTSSLVGVSPGSSKELVGLQCALDYPQSS